MDKELNAILTAIQHRNLSITEGRFTNTHLIIGNTYLCGAESLRLSSPLEIIHNAHNWMPLHSLHMAEELQNMKQT